jgi:hypothetical protein
MQALSIRLANGMVLNPTDWTSSPYYTTVEIGTGAQQALEGFSYGENGSVPGSVGPRAATKRDTNFQGPGGTLMENEEMLIFSIQIELYQVATNNVPSSGNTFYAGGQVAWAADLPEVTADNLMACQRSIFCQLKIANTKTYSENVLPFYGAGQGIHRTTGAMRSQWSTYANGELIGYNGGVSVGEQRQFATPHHVNGGEALSFILDFPFGSVVEPLSQISGSGVAASALNFGNDTNARIRAVISAIGPRRRPVA